MPITDAATRSRALRAAAACAIAVLALAAPASADEAAAPPAAAKDAWGGRFDAARATMLDGRYREAERALRALADDASTPAERDLALGMARLARAYAERAERQPPPPPPTAATRTSDEMALLYASAFLYGVGSGVFYLLETSPDSAFTATLPFTALTVAPVIAVATVDGTKRFARGVPHSISAGMYLGLGEGVWLTAMQHARTARVRAVDPATDARWTPEAVAGVLWGGATLGATLGGALGSALVTTPGRVSFTASTTVWSGTLSGLAAGAILPDDASREERAYGAAGAGYNAGLLGGLLFAGAVSPTVARVRIVDLLGVAGGLASTGIYLSAADKPDTRLAEGLGALGAGAGLAAGWIVTRGMRREVRGAEPHAPAITAQPTIVPVTGGAALGLAGAM